jgi:hypothetical protein
VVAIARGERKFKLKPFYPMSRIQFKQLEILLIEYFKTQGQIFCSQGRMMQAAIRWFYFN